MRILVAGSLAVAWALGFTALAAAAEGDPPPAVGDAAKGKPLFPICSACHGALGEGKLAMNAPRIGGQLDVYTVKQIHAFQDAIRGADPRDTYGAIMRPMAAQLASPDAVENIAAYVATLEPPTSERTLQGDPTKGQVTFAICAACHGSNGMGNRALKAPRLAGQHDWYIQRQIQNFRDKVRGAHKLDRLGRQMQPMAALLQDKDAITDVAAYIASMH